MFIFLNDQNIILDTTIIKISHVDHNIWNKLDSSIFGVGHFAKIQYGHNHELIATSTPSKIDQYDLL